MTTDATLAAAAMPGQPSHVQFLDWGIRLGRRTILTQIDLQLGTPGVVVVMGPAGTGKSTLLKTLAGQASSTAQYSGRLLIDGVAAAQARRLPALVKQHPRELAMSVFDALADALRDNGSVSPQALRDRVHSTLQALQQHDLLEHLGSRLFELPRDAMRRALIVRAALSGSGVLLIDEPTSDLADDQAATLLALIRALSQHHCCVLVLHHQAQARAIADRVVLLAGGRVQVDAAGAAFFANTDEHPVLAQFLRTGSCHVASPDAQPEDLDLPAAHSVEPVVPSPPAPAAAPPTPAAPAPPADVPAASRGPNGFHWLLPGKLAGCPLPGAMLPLEHDLALLQTMGVTVLINLTEQPMTQTAIPAMGLRTLHMRVEDRDAPPLMWLKMLLVRIDRLIQQGEVVAVHCLAGLGRTGTVLAAWLVREGLTAEESLRRLRLIEPRFVQSRVQEQLLHELEANLLIRAPTL